MKTYDVKTRSLVSLCMRATIRFDEALNAHQSWGHSTCDEATCPYAKRGKEFLADAERALMERTACEKEVANTFGLDPVQVRALVKRTSMDIRLTVEEATRRGTGRMLAPLLTALNEARTAAA